jgi:hypothetical protein
MSRKAPRASDRKTPRKLATGHLPPRKVAEVKGGSLSAYFEEVTGEKQGPPPKK